MQLDTILPNIHTVEVKSKIRPLCNAVLIKLSIMMIHNKFIKKPLIQKVSKMLIIVGPFTSF